MPFVHSQIRKSGFDRLWEAVECTTGDSADMISDMFSQTLESGSLPVINNAFEVN